MSIEIGVVMDPIDKIKTVKDTTLALLLEAQRRDWQIGYMEMADLFVRDGQPLARYSPVQVADDPHQWYRMSDSAQTRLSAFDIILMRKDPPFDMEYIYATYILEMAEQAGTLVANRPGALRDISEKMSITAFPQCCTPTLVSRDMGRLRSFIREQPESVVKPLDGMGGTSVFRVARHDPNTSVVLETVTANGTRFVMAQRYLSAISDGDKRILMIDGEPFPYALARIPAEGESRGNLAAGGQGVGVEMSERDRWICDQVAPTLKARGLYFVGVDIIGDYLTEINVTSPTCLRELERIYSVNIAAQLLDALQRRLH